jgi:hypothetical protein
MATGCGGAYPAHRRLASAAAAGAAELARFIAELHCRACPQAIHIVASNQPPMSSRAVLLYVVAPARVAARRDGVVPVVNAHRAAPANGRVSRPRCHYQSACRPGACPAGRTAPEAAQSQFVRRPGRPAMSALEPPNCFSGVQRVQSTTAVQGTGPRMQVTSAPAYSACRKYTVSLTPLPDHKP